MAGDEHGPDAPDDRSGDEEIGAAVDDAMRDEIKRQMIAQIVGLDRGEGVGRNEVTRDDSVRRFYRGLGGGDPDDPDDPDRPDDPRPRDE